MKIIIPMAGIGERFIREGYADPKPFITVMGKPIIKYICEMFDRDNDQFLFLCNRDHLNGIMYRDLLYGLVRHGITLPVANHKLGAVYTVASTAYDYIEDDEPVIVVHCDTPFLWNYDHFKEFVKDKDGCIVSNVGFHPHSLSSTVFAHSLTEGDKVLDVKEKAFYKNRFTDHASCGCYYFAMGAYVKYYFNELIEHNINHNGEHYITLVYNLMIKDGMDIRSYIVDKVLSLGIPNEVRNFEAWMTILEGGQVKNAKDLVNCYKYWKEYVDYKP